MDVLVKYHYAGNVRELENIIHRAVVLARGETITTADLPIRVTEARSGGQQPEAASFVERVAEFERTLIVEALDRARGVQTRAARSLGMSERHLRYKLRKYGLATASGREAADEEAAEEPRR
jgi:two-component system NtrC family response regulator